MKKAIAGQARNDILFKRLRVKPAMTDLQYPENKEILKQVQNDEGFLEVPTCF